MSQQDEVDRVNLEIIGLAGKTRPDAVKIIQAAVSLSNIANRDLIDALNKIHDLAGQMSGPASHTHIGAIQACCHKVLGPCKEGAHPNALCPAEPAAHATAQEALRETKESIVSHAHNAAIAWGGIKCDHGRMKLPVKFVLAMEELDRDVDRLASLGREAQAAVAP